METETTQRLTWKLDKRCWRWGVARDADDVDEGGWWKSSGGGARVLIPRSKTLEVDGVTTERAPSFRCRRAHPRDREQREESAQKPLKATPQEHTDAREEIIKPRKKFDHTHTHTDMALYCLEKWFSAGKFTLTSLSFPLFLRPLVCQGFCVVFTGRGGPPSSWLWSSKLLKGWGTFASPVCRFPEKLNIFPSYY